MRFDDRDEADFLTEEGQLKYDLSVEVEEFKFFGVNTNVHFDFIARINNFISKKKEQYIIQNCWKLP